MSLAAVNPKFGLLRGYIDWDLGRSAEGGKDYAGAVRLYSSALQFGESALFLNERGTAYLNQKKYAEAYADLIKARDADPCNPGILTSLGGACYGLGQNSEASKYLHQASVLDAGAPAIAQWQKWIGNDLIVRGSEKLQARAFEDALELFDRAVEFDPNSADAFYYRAAANASLGRVVPATNDALNAIRLNPHHMASYQLLGQIYAAHGDWESMISAWSKFIALEPGNAGAYLERSAAYMQKGNPDAALRDAQKACSLGENKGCAFAARIQSGQ
jgi:tetratricopeptide (TPR) repeat protein